MVISFYALILSQLINPDFVDLMMKSVFRVFKLKYNFILKPHFDGNMTGELLYSPDFSEAVSERIICNKDIILEFGYKPEMPKDAKYTIRAVNLKTKRMAESVMDKKKWDCYYNLFASVEGKMVCIRAWKMNLCVYDLISFITIYDMPHVYKKEIFPNFSRYLSKTYVYILNILLIIFSSRLNIMDVIVVNFVLLVCFFMMFLEKEVIWRYCCIEFAQFIMSVQEKLTESKYGLFLFKKMKFLQTCCPDDRKIKESKYVSKKFLITGWKGHSPYQTNDRISIPICITSLQKHLLDLPFKKDEYFEFNLKGVDAKVTIAEVTSYKNKIKVETNNSLEQKMEWQGYVKVPNFHCFLDALKWLQKENTYHIRTFQPYREVMHAKNIMNILRDINEQDFLGFGVLVIKRNYSFYIGNDK